MKRILALALTLTLSVPLFMTSSLEVKAEGTKKCEHGCGREALSQEYGGMCVECIDANNIDENWGYIYTPEGDDYDWGAHCHKTTFQCKLDGCGYEKENEYNTVCSLVDGVCAYCGQQRPNDVCSHSECDNVIEDDYPYIICRKCSEGVGDAIVYLANYRYIDKATHYADHICAACESYLRTVTAPHQSLGACRCFSDVDGKDEGTRENNSDSAPIMTEEEIAEMKAAEVEKEIAAEEAIPVTSFISAEAVNAIPAEIKGTTTEAVYNVSKITTTRGFVAAVDKIVKANPEGKTVTFYSQNPFAFNVSSLEVLANANKEFIYMFKYDGQLYKVTIPAGAKVDLEGQTFAGPLYIGAKLGTTTLVK